jgi:hypothetical protein
MVLFFLEAQQHTGPDKQPQVKISGRGLVGLLAFLPVSGFESGTFS